MKKLTADATEIAVAAERERCATLADDLATRWEVSAMKCRTHTFTTGGWFSKPRTHVIPQYEQMAKSLDDAAHGLRTVSRGIREGWTYKGAP